MKMLRLAVALLLAPSIPFAQKPSGPLIVGVHASPYCASLTYTLNISKQRFGMRNATIVNMIDFVQGRPDDDGREDPAAAGLGIEGAFRKQLGLRLVKQPGSYPALILDHIERIPTQN